MSGASAGGTPLRRLIVTDDRQVSGDINHNRTTLMFLGLLWMLGRYGLRPEEQLA